MPRVHSSQDIQTAREGQPLTAKTMTHPVSVEILGALVVKQLLEYGVVALALEGDDEGVHLIEPWRLTIDNMPIRLPSHALLDVLPEEEAIRRLLSMGMSEKEVALALEERDRRLRAQEG